MSSPPTDVRVLIKRTCALGDLVLTLPFLFFLRRRRPLRKLHFLGHDSHISFLKKYRYIDEGSSIETSNWHLLYVAKIARRQKLRPDPSDFSELYLIGSEQENLELKSNLEGIVKGRLRLLSGRPPEGMPIHAARFLVEQIPELNPGDGAPLEEGFRPLQEIEGPLREGPRILIHPGSGSPKKNWPASRFARLMEALQKEGYKRIGIVQGPQDAEPVRDLFRKGAQGEILLCEDLLHLLRILKGGALYIGNDSGPTHLAAALGVPTLAIFGPSDPLQWSPMGSAVTVLYNAKAACAPCHLSPGRTCEEDICLRFPTWERVVHRALGLLQCVPHP
jgi:ADP-heptose:LPS heptosyltransferase